MRHAGPVFVAPWLIGLLTLFAYPFAASFYWSFCEYDLLNPPRWIGWAHYERLAEELWVGGGFRRAAWNTAYFASLSVPLSIGLGVLLATLLSQQKRGRGVLRTIFFLPSVVPVVASAILWTWLLDPRQGLVNRVLLNLGLPTSQWLWFKGASEALAPPHWFDFGSKDGLILMGLWGSGNAMMIYLAALGDIPRQLYEAAELDGAGQWRRFRHITLPLLSPVIFFNLVMGLIQSVQAFTQVDLVSEGTGEPAGATLMLSLHLFLAAFQDLDMGYASAIAWLLFLVLLTATALLFRTAKYWVYYPGLVR
jgi:multiple sugar transport system permease protein